MNEDCLKHEVYLKVDLYLLWTSEKGWELIDLDSHR